MNTSITRSEVLRELTKPQHLYDGMLKGLNHPKSVTVAIAALSSLYAFYVKQPKTFEDKFAVIATCSSLAFFAVKTSHHVSQRLRYKSNTSLLAEELKEFEANITLMMKKQQEYMSHLQENADSSNTKERANDSSD